MLSLELGIVTVLVIHNGLLAMSELAVVSSRPARLQGLAANGVSGSKTALALASDTGKFLSTIQTGNPLCALGRVFQVSIVGRKHEDWERKLLPMWFLEMAKKSTNLN
ncbi:MAG TPA: CNNM domain-containing protein [Bradyrhizobium sp.]|nr:CNNM domain-containing protein [Bradyrhizobium sp.]